MFEFEQKVIIVYILKELMSLEGLRDDTIKKLVNLIISESIHTERYDLLKRLVEHKLI